MATKPRRAARPRPATAASAAPNAAVVTAAQATSDDRLLICVPLYKGAHLVPDLLASLRIVADELKLLRARVILINDSPDDAPLRAALEAEFPALEAATDAELWVNDRNLGFLGTANRGMALALEKRIDVVLLNSDALLTPGALAEMVAVARLDPLTSVVSPRSNNATICNSPYPDRFRTLDFPESVTAHLSIQPFLPRVTYAPTAVGFCLLIRWQMLAEFGLFDPAYGGGYNEENDLIMRCNRRGYRAVLANHAFVHHLGSVSFSMSPVAPSAREEANRKLLLERYPEYDRAVADYFGGVDYACQRLLGGLAVYGGDKPRVIFDCRHVGAFHNGTHEMTVKLLRAFVREFYEVYDCYIACSHASLVFHGLDKIVGLSFCWNAEDEMAPFAFAILPAQPFDIRQLVSLSRLAPVTFTMMLDTISYDCLNLDGAKAGLMWSRMLQTVSGVGYNSHFSQQQFSRRFPLPEQLVEAVALHSTDPAEYVDAAPEPAAPAEGRAPVLVVGNHYAHKHVQMAVDALLARPDRPPVCVLGVNMEPREGLTSYHAGELEQALVDSLYDSCACVLFPSHYEGFGFPVMHGLARRKPVIARNLPVFEEIRRRTPGHANLHLVDTTEAMVDAALATPAWLEESAPDLPPETWASGARALADGLERARAALTYGALKERLTSVRVLAELAASQDHAHGLWEQNQDLRELRIRFAPKPDPAMSFQLPAAPAGEMDPAFWAGEFARVRVERAVRTGARNGLLRRLGAAVWSRRRLAQGAVLRTGEELAATPIQGLGWLQVDGAWERLPDDALSVSLLEWVDRVALGGKVRVVTASGDGDRLAARSPSGLRVWLLSAGVHVTSVTQNGQSLTAEGFRTLDWSAGQAAEVDDDAFVTLAFHQALGRDPDGHGQVHCRNLLASGDSRRSVLRHLFASPERRFFVYQTLS